MSDVNFLNLEYFLLRTYELFTGTHLNAGEAAAHVVVFWGQLTIVGLVLALILLIATVWVRIRLLAAEHAGLHKRYEESHRGAAAAHLKEENTRWEEIVALASSPQPSDWRRAIIEADIMLGDLLTERGYLGETLGDQLKGANPLQFTTLDLAWQAHKVRNAIAHLGEAYPLSEREVRATIDLYRRVFEEFEVL